MNPSGEDSRRFPATPWTAILEAQGNSSLYRECLERLLPAYWRPVYWWIRKKTGCGDEAACDLTQEFFGRVLEQEIVRFASRDRGRFRTFLLSILQNFLADRRRHDTAEKRGAGSIPVSLDRIRTEKVDWEPSSDTLTPEEAYDQCWRACLLRQAWEEVEAGLVESGKDLSVRIFRRMVLDPSPQGPPSYRELADELGVDAIDVRDRLARVKHLVQAAVRKKIREYSLSAEDVEREISELFGSGL